MDKVLLSLDLLEKNLQECKSAVKAGKDSQEMLNFFIALKEDMKNRTSEEWASANELIINLPDDEYDSAFIVLRGNLLIEELVRKFISLRLPNYSILEKRNVSYSINCAIGESLCLPTKESEWLWSMINELNRIRNKVAHQIRVKDFDNTITRFINEIAEHHTLTENKIGNAISYLYGMVNGLCQIANKKEFKLF